MNENYNISRCNNMQWTGIYSLHTAMCALRPGGGGGGGRGGEKVVRILLLQKSCACALQLPALPPPTLTKFNEGNQIHKFMSSSGTGTVINYGTGSDFLTNYGSGQLPVPVPVPQHWYRH